MILESMIPVQRYFIPIVHLYLEGDTVCIAFMTFRVALLNEEPSCNEIIKLLPNETRIGWLVGDAREKAGQCDVRGADMSMLFGTW